MNKKIIIGVLALAVCGYFIGEVITSGPSENLSDQNEVEEILGMKPDRAYDIYGKVVKLEGNLVTVAELDLSSDPTLGMSTDEKQAYMQTLPEEERMALKEAIQGTTLGETTLTIPIGTPMSKKTESGKDALDTEATLADVTVGVVVSVWYDETVMDRLVAEFVKVSMSK